MRDTDNRDASPEHRASNTSPLPEPPSAWQRGAFEYEKLDAFAIAREALARGDRIARRFPRGYAKLADQLRRALLSTYLGIAEAASRTGDDRRARFRCSRGEASEAAAALDAACVLQLASADEVREVVTLLARVAAMLTRLAKLPR
jgi:four helix bundle protein